MIVIAIDPSLTQTAVAIGRSPADVRVSLHCSKSLGQDAGQRVRRYEALVANIMDGIRDSLSALDRTSGEDIRIFIEGYAFGAKCGREVLGEFGGLIRWHLVDLDRDLVEVQPMSLKKFTTGKGAGQKDQMMMHALRNWGYQSANSDACDAYSLFRLGLVVLAVEQPQNAIQREVAKKFTPF